NFFHPTRPIYTRPRFLPAARVHDSQLDAVLVAEGAWIDSAEVRHSIVGVRTTIQRGARVTNSVLLGADKYDEQAGTIPLGIGPDVVLDRVIVDKNARIGAGARLVNEAGVQELDGDGYYIRSGIIIVPKNGVVAPVRSSDRRPAHRARRGSRGRAALHGIYSPVTGTTCRS